MPVVTLVISIDIPEAATVSVEHVTESVKSEQVASHDASLKRRGRSKKTESVPLATTSDMEKRHEAEARQVTNTTSVVEITDRELNIVCNEVWNRTRNRVAIEALRDEYTNGGPTSTIPSESRAQFLE